MPESVQRESGPFRARGGTRVLRLAPTDRVLFVAPHPDDDILAAGGLLQHAAELGGSVRILYVTRGENNPWAQRVHERRWRIGQADRERWARLRRGEALASLDRLGLPAACARFLAFHDQGLTDLAMSGGGALIELLADEIAFWKPTLILLPAIFDAHPDHNSLGALAHLALARVPADLPRPKELAFVIHRPRRPVPPGKEHYTLSRPQVERKRLAILCHRSQLHLRRRFLLGFAREAEAFHTVSGGPDADALHPVREVFAADGRLHIVIRKPRAPRVARSELLVLSADSAAEPTRIRVEYDVRGRSAYQYDTTNGSKPVPVAMRLTSDLVELSLPRWDGARSGVPPILFAKVDHPGIRRIGFFDSAGWRCLDAFESAGADGRLRRSEAIPAHFQEIEAARVPDRESECEVAPERP